MLPGTFGTRCGERKRHVHHLWGCFHCDSESLCIIETAALKRQGRLLVGNKGTGIIQQDSYSCGRIVLRVREGKNNFEKRTCFIGEKNLNKRKGLYNKKEDIYIYIYKFFFQGSAFWKSLLQKKGLSKREEAISNKVDFLPWCFFFFSHPGGVPAPCWITFPETNSTEFAPENRPFGPKKEMDHLSKHPLISRGKTLSFLEGNPLGILQMAYVSDRLYRWKSCPLGHGSRDTGQGQS